MTRKLTEADFPMDAEYSIIHAGGKPITATLNKTAMWNAYANGVVFEGKAAMVRCGFETTITRDEAIRIVKARGQWEDAPVDELPKPVPSPTKCCTCGYAGGAYQEHDDDCPARAKRKYGGPHDDAADAWAARGMRVKEWGVPRKGDRVILYADDYYKYLPTNWSEVYCLSVDWDENRTYIVEPLPTQPESDKDTPLADLTRRVAEQDARIAALEAVMPKVPAGATGPIVTAPPMPPLPVVPECGYWLRWHGSSRHILANPPEWRLPREDDVYLGGLRDYAHKIDDLASRYDANINNGCRFILRELIEPTAPKGYTITGWRKPKDGEWFIDPPSNVPIRWVGEQCDHFRWCIAAAKNDRIDYICLIREADRWLVEVLIDDGTDMLRVEKTHANNLAEAVRKIREISIAYKAELRETIAARMERQDADLANLTAAYEQSMKLDGQRQDEIERLSGELTRAREAIAAVAEKMQERMNTEGAPGDISVSTVCVWMDELEAALERPAKDGA